MYGSYKEFYQVKSLSKNKALYQCMLLPSAGLSLNHVKLYSMVIYQPALDCLIQQEKTLPDQSRKEKNAT